MRRNLGVLLWCVYLLSTAGCNRNDKNVNPSGTLEATEVEVTSVLSARALSVRTALGAHVRAGDTLVVLDTELLALQKAQTAANRRALDAQRAVLRDQLSQATSSLKLAETNLARVKALTDEGSASVQQLDETDTKHTLAKSQVELVRHQLDQVAAEELKLDAALAVLERQLRDGYILAPATGTITMKALESGETVTPAGVLMRIADLTTLELRVFLGADDLDRVKIGDSYTVLVDALAGQALKGTATWISAEAEFTPKNAQTKAARTQLVYAVKLDIQNSEQRLHIGMPAELVLP
jgi:HlyD family secretion protein